MALPVALFLKRRYHAISGTELWILIVVIALTIAFSGARIGLVIFPLLLLMMLFYILPPKRKIIAAGGLLLALAGAVFLFCALPENNFTERFKDPIREQLFETAVASIQENPLLGTGTGGMVAPINSPELAEKLGYAEPQPFTYPHNQYLGEVMHFGFIGAVALFVTLAYLVFLALRKKDFLLQSVLVILFVFMLSEMPFDSNKGITFALFFISLFVYTLPLRTGGGLKSA
jgi:O-antigen ligase